MRLQRIERLRLPFAHGAKSAAARADIARDHKSRRAVRPAFIDVRAFRFLANRVQTQVVNQVLHFLKIAARIEPDFQPAWFRSSLFRMTHSFHYSSSRRALVTVMMMRQRRI